MLVLPLVTESLYLMRLILLCGWVCPSVVEPAKLSTTTPLRVSSVLTKIESAAEAAGCKGGHYCKQNCFHMLSYSNSSSPC